MVDYKHFGQQGRKKPLIALILKSLLMHFKHRYLTSDELASLKPIDITDWNVPWNPHKFEDDPLKIDYVVRSAEDPNKRNRRAHFENFTDDILDQQDEILGMPGRGRHKKERKPRDQPVFI